MSIILDTITGVSSGSDAIFLALRAMNVQKEDEVIVPANTFIATAFAVERSCAKIVFADCDPYTWEFDPASIEKNITKNTKGIICVHLYGQMCLMDKILKIADQHNLFIIEDCAQSHGSRYKGKCAGTFGHAGAFIFYPTKNLGACGEAGGVSCSSDIMTECIRCLRSQGSHEKYRHDELGYNMRMDGIQGAILLEKLNYLSEWNERRGKIVKMYHENIYNKKIRWQAEISETNPAWHLAVACVDDRNSFLDYMRSKGIICGIHYPIPCHLQKAMRHYGYKPGDFSNAENQSAHCVSLPLFPKLTDDEVQYVIETCMKY